MQRANSATVAVSRAEAAMMAGDRAQAMAWIRRAYRLAPEDVTVLVVGASVGLHLDPSTAIAECRALTRRVPWSREAAMTLCVVLLRAGRDADAAVSLAELLGRLAPTDSDAFRQLARSVCAAVQAPGWIGMNGAGRCSVVLPGAERVRTVRIALDGQPLRSLRVRPGEVASLDLPPGWRQAKTLVAVSGGEALIGSPLWPARFNVVEGFAGTTPEAGVTGWARVPADPDTIPPVFLHRPGQGPERLEMVSDPAGEIGSQRTRWRFHVEAAQLPRSGMVDVLDGEGRQLWGSPLLLGDEHDAAQAAARTFAGAVPALPDRFRPLPVSLLPQRRPAARRSALARVPCDVVVPVYAGLAELDACLASLAKTLPRGSRLVLVNDGSPDPAIAARLAQAASPAVTVLAHDRPRGFPAAVNAGLLHLKAGSGRDVVILNADTIVSPHWLKRLSAAAHSDPAIGSCTPLTNDGTLTSYPEPGGNADTPGPAALAKLNDLCWAANGPAAVDIPTGVGFCMLMKGACLEEVGLFRDDVFAQGYGEENDWCLRAAHLGWRTAAAPGVFVAHSGGRSFGAAKALLMERNSAVLERLHPGYAAYVEKALAQEPLLPARRRVDRLKLLRSPGSGAVALITHDAGGGVERHVAWRCAEITRAGRRPIVLSPDGEKPGRCTLALGMGDGATVLPNLRFSLPGESSDLEALLAEAGVERFEIHHLLHHDPSISEVPARLGVPYDVFIHDYGHWCPRISLTSRGNRYCGEPLSPVECEECIADLGSRYGDDVTVGGLRAHSARLLRNAGRVAVSCEDVATRIRRQFPAIRPEIVPWEDDAPRPPPVAVAATRRALPAVSPVEVLVVGAIGVEKGYDVLLGCARDAARRDLPLRFTVVGFTVDDDRLMDTGRLFVTGKFTEGEALGLVQQHGATIGFVPSVCPETWCYALSILWHARLPVMAFELGAQGFRIAQSGAGWLLPVGIPAMKINDALVSRGRETLQTTAANLLHTGAR